MRLEQAGTQKGQKSLSEELGPQRTVRLFGTPQEQGRLLEEQKLEQLGMEVEQQVVTQQERERFREDMRLEQAGT